jgi:hypothetical protein
LIAFDGQTDGSVLKIGFGVALNTTSKRGETQAGHSSDAGSTPVVDLGAELLSALTGRDANRERAVAHRTRRVVLSSHGVMQEQKQDRSRVRGVALAVTLLVLLLIAPLVWEATDSLIAGEHLGDPGSQLSLWACIVCPTLLGAAVVAGWWRKRS